MLVYIFAIGLSIFTLAALFVAGVLLHIAWHPVDEIRLDERLRVAAAGQATRSQMDEFNETCDRR